MSMLDSFRALVVRETSRRQFQRSIEERTIEDLPPGDLLIRVLYSSLNYKDALSAVGNRGVTRKYPHTPGIDAAGVIVDSADERFKAGDEVICMGFDLGMNTAGGFGGFIRVPADWVLPKPASISLYESMQVGTAGFTAAQCVDRLLDQGVRPGDGPVLVTGATGGVAITAIALLGKLGYSITAVTGKERAHSLLRQLGCSEVMNRKQAVGRAGAAMLRERWAGVVDTVGGEILAGAIKATCYGGVVTCCGNAASGELPLTVYPFILRGVSLLGIDSADCPMARRRDIWRQLAGPWRLQNLDMFSSRISLDQLNPAIDAMLAGELNGRLVVDLAGECQ